MYNYTYLLWGLLVNVSILLIDGVGTSRKVNQNAENCLFVAVTRIIIE